MSMSDADASTPNASLSLWDGSALERDLSLPMNSDLVTDVAIVGGGYTGLSTALHLAERGIECHVLEAKQIGYGGSGRSVGLVNAGLWLPPQDCRHALGEDYGAKLIDTLGKAPEYVFSLIEKHQMQCEPTRSGTIHAAHSPRGLRGLARRHEEWVRLGAPVELLDGKQASDKIGTEVYCGGLLDHRAGTINPMGYVRGLARAALGAGAKIHTGVHVTKLAQEDGKWLLATDKGTVKANTVILGTNAYTDELWPGLNKTFTMIHFFQVASEPMGERASGILREGHGLWDTGTVMTSLRRDAFGRVIIGSMGKVVGGANGLSETWAGRMTRRLFPDLGPVKWEKAWHGQIALTGDHLPRIHRLAPGLYTPVGYNGRGITTGTVFGRAMAELLSGGQEDQLPLPITEPKTAITAPIMSRLYQMAFTANQFIKSI